MASVWNHLEILDRESEKPEAEVIALALETGLRQLWRERALSRYLRGEIARDEAIEAAGAEWVELAERQHRAMKEDLAWAPVSSVASPADLIGMWKTEQPPTDEEIARILDEERRKKHE